MDEIKITANRSLDEPWRLNRLHGFLGALMILCDRNCGTLQEIGLLAVHDHKGNLGTAWDSFDNASKHAEAVCKAWSTFYEVGVDFHVRLQGSEIQFQYENGVLAPSRYMTHLIRFFDA